MIMAVGPIIQYISVSLVIRNIMALLSELSYFAVENRLET